MLSIDHNRELSSSKGPEWSIIEFSGNENIIEISNETFSLIIT